MNTDFFKKRENEQFDEYCHRVSSSRDALELTWNEIAEIINEVWRYDFSGDKYRKQEKRYCAKNNCVADILEEKNEEDNELCDPEEIKLKIGHYKKLDERTQLNAMYRRISREETLKEIAHDAVESLKDLKLEVHSPILGNSLEESAILVISDWHYGIDINSYFNQ